MDAEKFIKISNELPIRHQNLAKYSPFFQLQRLPYRTEGKCYGVDYGVLLLATMSFILYEGHLKEKTVDTDQIHEFLGRSIYNYYGISLNPQELTSFATHFLDKIQNTGNPFEYTYYDNIRRENITMYVRYIRSSFDPIGKNVIFNLTQDGIDFLLQTKEFGEESKLTIHLLLLRKLVEDGDYTNALQALDNVITQVQKERVRKHEIIEQLSFGQTDGYYEYTETANKRLNEEKDLFAETMQFLSGAQEKYEKNIDRKDMDAKHIKFFEFLKDMNVKLVTVQRVHSSLLSDVVTLRSMAQETLATRRRNMFKEYLDFTAILNRIVKNKAPEHLINVISPLLRHAPDKSFPVEKVNDLLLWKMAKEDEKPIETELEDQVDVAPTIDAVVLGRVLSNFQIFMHTFLKCAIELETFDLHQYITFLKQTCGSQVTANYDLISFIALISRDSGTDNEARVFNYHKLKSFKNKDDESTESIRIESVYMSAIEAESHFRILKSAIITALPDPNNLVTLVEDNGEKCGSHISNIIYTMRKEGV